jgi:hypothetical protein
VPNFCRHNRLVQNCPICSREQSVELRPIVSSSTPRLSERRSPASQPSSARRSRAPSTGGGARAGLRVSRLPRGTDDGYRCALVPGLRSSEDARRLADELAFASRRLTLLADDPPGLYAEVGSAQGEIEERTWLAFLIAYLCPLDEPDPFSEICRVRTTWASSETPALEHVRLGPRGAHDAGRGARTLDAYRAWAARAGSQSAACVGESGWSPERRFARVFERLALPGLHRGARFELLLTLGRLDVYELRPGSLALGGDDPVTVAAKRALGIGDSLLLERRAAALADACQVALGALDLAFYSWERGERAGLGFAADLHFEPEVLERLGGALGL